MRWFTPKRHVVEASVMLDNGDGEDFYGDDLNWYVDGFERHLVIRDKQTTVATFANWKSIVGRKWNE